MEKQDWIWMPHPGHLCVSRQCNFRLNTCVGHYIVSTVGEYLPVEGIREIFAKSRGVVLQGQGDERVQSYMDQIGYEPLGCGKELYETMVFHAKSSKEKCCPKTSTKTFEIETKRYLTASEAYKGHLKLCNKWSKKEKGDI